MHYRVLSYAKTLSLAGLVAVAVASAAHALRRAVREKSRFAEAPPPDMLFASLRTCHPPHEGPTRGRSKRPFRNWLSGVQLVEQRLCLLQVERVEAFSEPAIGRSEKIVGPVSCSLAR